MKLISVIVVAFFLVGCGPNKEEMVSLAKNYASKCVETNGKLTTELSFTDYDIEYKIRCEGHKPYHEN